MWTKVSLGDNEIMQIRVSYEALPKSMRDDIKLRGMEIATGDDAPRAEMAKLILAEICEIEAMID